MSTASLERTFKDVARLPRNATLAGAKAVEKVARDVAAGVGPVTLGRKGRRVKLRAITRKKGSFNDPTAIVYGVPTGPWVWVTAGTGGHVIPKARRRGKARTTRYLKAPGYAHPYGKPVHHPGATGKGAWRRVVSRAGREVHNAALDEARKVIRHG